MTEGDASNGSVRPAVGGRRSFSTTHWSVVLRAADLGTEEGRSALEQLCRTYWRPLYSFARWQGLSPADAEDLTQGFFEDLLERGAIGRADAERGRFRTFLLTSFRNFHAHRRRESMRQKRGGGVTFLSIEAMREAETRFQEEPATTETPERIFDRKWAASLLADTLAAVRHEYTVVGKEALFDELKPLLWGVRHEGGHAASAERLGMTEGAVKVAVHRLRHRFAEQLRAEVAKTVQHPEDIEEELRHLLGAVSS